jgi:hypothetical protein
VHEQHFIVSLDHLRDRVDLHHRHLVEVIAEPTLAWVLPIFRLGDHTGVVSSEREILVL